MEEISQRTFYYRRKAEKEAKAIQEQARSLFMENRSRTQKLHMKRLIVFYGDMLPLKSYNNIVEDNTLVSIGIKKQSDDMAFIWGKRDDR